jgi:hypothetical protein
VLPAVFPDTGNVRLASWVGLFRRHG